MNAVRETYWGEWTLKGAQIEAQGLCAPVLTAADLPIGTEVYGWAHRGRTAGHEWIALLADLVHEVRPHMGLISVSLAAGEHILAHPDDLFLTAPLQG